MVGRYTTHPRVPWYIFGPIGRILRFYLIFARYFGGISSGISDGITPEELPTTVWEKNPNTLDVELPGDFRGIVEP